MCRAVYASGECWGVSGVSGHDRDRLLPRQRNRCIHRVIGHGLEAALNRSVVIENKVAANAAIAAAHVARAAQDGYTLLAGTSGHMPPICICSRAILVAKDGTTAYVTLG